MTKSIFNPRREAEIFLESSHFIFQYETIFEYKNGFYQVCKERPLKNRIAKQLDNRKDQSRKHKVQEVLDSAKDILSAEDFTLNSNPETINTKNGLLDLNTMTLQSHSPAPVFLCQMNANYDPNAKCPSFIKFLEEILVDNKDHTQPDEELISIIQEFLGYCFYPDLPFHKALILYGGGSNGKSVLISVIKQLLKGLHSHVRFESIGKDLFATSDLAGKLLNISPEVSVEASLSDGEVKALISGDTIRAQRKFENAFDFKPFAKHMITTNHLPSSNDRTLGFFRRFMIVPFHIAFLFPNQQKLIQRFKSEGKPYMMADPFLTDKLTDELDGIFLWAVKGLQRLLERKDFSYSRQVEEMGEILESRSSTVERFTQKHFDKTNVTASTPLKDAYDTYVKFCQGLGIPPLKSKGFSSNLRDSAYVVSRGTGNVYYVLGVDLIWVVDKVE